MTCARPALRNWLGERSGDWGSPVTCATLSKQHRSEDDATLGSGFEGGMSGLVIALARHLDNAFQNHV
jgi:hypothetical protein